MQAIQQKWDYRVHETRDLTAFQSSLSQFGQDGWELVNVLHGGENDPHAPVKTLRVRRSDTFLAVFKRPADA